MYTNLSNGSIHFQKTVLCLRYITILFVEENLGAGTLDLTFIPLNVILRFWRDNEIDKYHDYYKLILYDADDYLKAAEKGEHCLMHHIEKMIIKNRDLLNMINEWFFHDLSLKSFSGPYKHFYDLATVCNCDLGDLQNMVQDCFDVVFEDSAFFTEEEILKYESVFNKEYTVSDVREVLQDDKDFEELEITDMYIAVVTIDTSSFIENIKK